MMLCITPCYGGAWLQHRGGGQSIEKVSYTLARHNFAGSGAVKFFKLDMQSYTEHALSPYVTMFTSPEYTIAEYKMAYSESSGRDYAVTTGLRAGEITRDGAISLQISYKYGQAFSVTRSDNASSAQEVEIRPQFGQNLTLLGQHCFFDVEGIWRWTAPPRPNEAGFDATFGVHAATGTQILLQNFSIMSAGYGASDYVHYRLHKFEFSLVQHLWHGWQVQLGGIYAYAGRNVVAERGVSLSLWVNL